MSHDSVSKTILPLVRAKHIRAENCLTELEHSPLHLAAASLHEA